MEQLVSDDEPQRAKDMEMILKRPGSKLLAWFMYRFPSKIMTRRNKKRPCYSWLTSINIEVRARRPNDDLAFTAHTVVFISLLTRLTEYAE